jgi:hypothetical protein
MSFELTNEDYISILQYYNLPIPKSVRLIKKNAETIMVQKLCTCIKKIEPENESRSIGICTKTIFNTKGYKRGLFNCTKKQFVKFEKTNKFKNKTRRKK